MGAGAREAMGTHTLVQPLFEGPIDIVGDVHGEIDGLCELTRRLGYDARGRHPQERRLVFVGDLGDRGPDSPAVVEWVRDLVETGRGQCVLGNHDFNALHAVAGGEMKPELSWLFAEAPPLMYRGTPVPQTLVRGSRCDDLLAFFARLPIALERGGDLPVRVVHACWEPALVDRLRQRRDVIQVYQQEKHVLHTALDIAGEPDHLRRKLMLQNANAVKRLTSGLEGRSAKAIVINDRPRWELRLPWWNDYADDVLCVIGHYWRISLPGEVKFENLFTGLPLNATHGAGPVMCIDYSAGKRYRERLHGGQGHHETRLAALRLPERQLVFDNAEPMALLARCALGSLRSQ